MIISIDLGGTKLLTALLDEHMHVIDQKKHKTPKTTDGDEVLKLMISLIEELLDEHGKPNIEGIGVGVPSAVNFDEGVVLSTTNIGFVNYPLKAKLESHFHVPVLVENDVNAGVYGEYRKGAGVGKRHIIGVYPGTGIGGGLILDGRLYRGFAGGAGELGHIMVQPQGRVCGCGSYGCLETVASKTALAKDLVQLAALGKAPTIYSKVGTDFAKIKSSHIEKSMAHGEQAVIDLVLRSGEFLGIGLANFVNIFNPELIVLGGGLIERLGSEYLEKVEQTMRQYAMPELSKHVQLTNAMLGDNTVIIGAAMLLSDSLH